LWQTEQEQLLLILAAAVENLASLDADNAWLPVALNSPLAYLAGLRCKFQWMGNNPAARCGGSCGPQLRRSTAYH
jgi:hypothetical protein